MLTYTLKVVAMIKESTEATTISFKQPSLKKINYQPGQYLTVIVNVNNRKYKRPYSISSAPGIDNTLNITIKRIPQGIVSNHLIDIIKEGDVLEVIEPLGEFVYNKTIHNDKEIFLWGAGSGVTPLISILKVVLNTSSQKINLFLSNKNLESTIFYDQLTQFKNKYSNQFSLFFFNTENVHPDAIKGRISEVHILNALKGVSNIQDTIHYICGPIGLKTIVIDTLIKQGLDKDNIFTEDFKHIVNETELEGVQTRFVDIIKDNENFNLEVIRGKSILEAGLDREIDLPYSCQTGSCTLCKATILQGEVKVIGDEKHDFELLADERLLCCSYPLTDNVKFKINK